MKNKLEPEIRFGGFSGNWEEKYLKNVVENVSGNDGRTDLPVLTISARNGWMNQEDRFSQIIAGNELKNYTLLKKGELSYNHGNSKLAKYGAVFELKSYEEALVPKVYHSFKANNFSYSSFLEYLFYSKIPDNELRKLVSSGARMDGLLNISKTAFLGITLTLPIQEEQIQIGNFFKKLDYTINIKEKELTSLKQTKQGFLQKMFPKDVEKVPEIRFNGFSVDWEEKKLKDFGKATGGTSIESEFVDNGVYKVISIGSYSEQSEYTEQGLRANETEKTKERVLNKNDLTMILNDKTSSGNIIGRVLLIDKDSTYVYNQRTERIQPNQDLYYSVFLYQLFNAPKIREKIIKQSQGNTQIYVNWSVICELNYLVPFKEEQTLIGNFFKQLDDTISITQKQLNILKQTKKAFLQKMFV